MQKQVLRDLSNAKLSDYMNNVAKSMVESTLLQAKQQVMDVSIYRRQESIASEVKARLLSGLSSITTYKEIAI